MSKKNYTWSTIFWFVTFALLGIGSCVGGGALIDTHRYGLGGSAIALAVVFMVFMFATAAGAKERQ